MSQPRTILLATDLGARSDRAMDRAAQLMTEWNSRLVVVHVLDPSATTTLSVRELATRARDELSEQLRDAGERVAIRIERGEPADAIRRVAREEGSSLIVTGVARNESFGRVKVGDTVNGVIRGLDIPLLVVTDRPRAPYRRVTVAIDFGDESRHALITALAMFPEPIVTVFHAHGAPGSIAAGDLRAHRAAFSTVAHNDVGAFLATIPLSPADNARLAIEVQFGEPAAQLVEWTESKQVELVVVGTRGRGRVGELFLGSVAKRVLGALSCDVLLVPPLP